MDEDKQLITMLATTKVNPNSRGRNNETPNFVATMAPQKRLMNSIDNSEENFMNL